MARFCVSRLTGRRQPRGRIRFWVRLSAFALVWGALAVLAAPHAWWTWLVFVVAAVARLVSALVVGRGVVHDPQVLRDLWLLPLRDLMGLGFWAWSFAGDTVVWRGERFHLHDGRLRKAGHLADAR